MELWLDGRNLADRCWWGFERCENGEVRVEVMETDSRQAHPLVYFSPAEARSLLAWLKEEFPEEG